MKIEQLYLEYEKIFGEPIDARLNSRNLAFWRQAYAVPQFNDKWSRWNLPMRLINWLFYKWDYNQWETRMWCYIIIPNDDFLSRYSMEEQMVDPDQIKQKIGILRWIVYQFEPEIKYYLARKALGIK